MCKMWIIEFINSDGKRETVYFRASIRDVYNLAMRNNLASVKVRMAAD